MSGIFGVIDFTKKTINHSYEEDMKSPYYNYCIDEYQSTTKENHMMGCALQHITKEAKLEQFPYSNEDKTIYLTADCVLDNRDELLSKLQLPSHIPDGALIFHAFLKWGRHCIHHLLGCFSFVVYDSKINEAYLFADHISSRSLFYYYSEGKVYFSTLIRSILKANNYNINKNKRWILDCMAMKTPIMITNPEETPFQGVKKVLAGCYVTIGLEKQYCIEYWNPIKKAKEWKRAKDTEYQHRLLSTLNNAVQSAIRTDGEVGIYLSSGLDSTSVACVAAPLLQKCNKNLYSFTAIPEESFINTHSSYYIVNESKGVLDICKQYPNIIPSFETSESKSILTEIDEIISITELPTKSGENVVWLNEIAKSASKKGCKILLDGQHGNSTLSNGHLREYFKHLFTNLHFIKAMKVVDTYGKYHRISRKRLAFSLTKSVFSEPFSRWLAKRDDLFQDVLVNKELAKCYKTNIRLRKNFYNSNHTIIPKWKEIKSDMFSKLEFSQVGEFKTKLGLKYGMLLRDPLADKHLIELTMTLPFSCFVSEGYERRLVRKYMKGIIPNTILDDTYHRGLQGADYLHRYNKHWKEYKDLFHQGIFSKDFVPYINKEKTTEYFNYFDHQVDAEHSAAFRQLTILYVMSKYFDWTFLNCP